MRNSLTSVRNSQPEKEKKIRKDLETNKLILRGHNSALGEILLQLSWTLFFNQKSFHPLLERFFSASMRFDKYLPISSKRVPGHLKTPGWDTMKAQRGVVKEKQKHLWDHVCLHGSGQICHEPCGFLTRAKPTSRRCPQIGLARRNKKTSITTCEHLDDFTLPCWLLIQMIHKRCADWMLSKPLSSFWTTTDIWSLKENRNSMEDRHLSLSRAILYPARTHPLRLPSPLTKSVSSLTTHWQAPSFSIIRLSILIFWAAAKLVSDLDASLWVAIDHLSLVTAPWHKRTGKCQLDRGSCQPQERNSALSNSDTEARNEGSINPTTLAYFCL